MRVLLQRTTQASVQIGGQIHGKINRGLVILVGICGDDTEDDARWLVQKIIQMRIFADSDGKMNLSVQAASNAKSFRVCVKGETLR
jgi:D-tyrosyl-tRNA(Tyr) deacylase